MIRTKLLLSIVSLSILIAAYFHYQEKKSIKKIVETNKNTEFTIEKDFKSVSWSIATGRFEEEILKINNATILDKNWSNKEFHLERPLRRSRYWEFDGTMKAKIRINNNKNIGTEDIDMVHEVKVDSNEITIKAALENPIDKIGLTSMNQEINIEKGDNNLTNVKVSIKMKVVRLIPKFLENYAQNYLDKYAEEQVQKIKEAISNLPEKKPGISIPLK